MRKAYIAGIEYYLPERILDNEELSGLFPDWTPEQIEKKTGVVARHIAAEDETSTDMAERATRKLFDAGKAKPDEIQFVILCTQSPDYFLPSSACVLQHNLGIPTSSGAMDIDLGCSGYVYGLSIAKGLIEAVGLDNVLLITSETYTKYLSPDDKGVRTLFGDGAAATIVRAGEPKAGPEEWIGPFVFGTDGAGAKSLIVEEGAARQWTAGQRENASRGCPTLTMDGPSIFSFTLKIVPRIVEQLATKGGTTKEGIDTFVFHQANSYMLEALRRQIGIPEQKFVLNFAEKGNTVSSTIPIAMVDAQKDGVLEPGSRLMLVGFGVGLSWGGCLAVLPHSI